MAQRLVLPAKRCGWRQYLSEKLLDDGPNILGIGLVDKTIYALPEGIPSEPLVGWVCLAGGFLHHLSQSERGNVCSTSFGGSGCGLGGFWLPITRWSYCLSRLHCILDGELKYPEELLLSIILSAGNGRD